MVETAQIELVPAFSVAEKVALEHATNGIHYGIFSELLISTAELEHMIRAIPSTVARALDQRTYYFVPLTIHEEDPDPVNIAAGETFIAQGYSVDLSDRAICHRNVEIGGKDCTFISTRLMREKFALAFELFINVGHHFVDAAGVPQEFADLVWSQAGSAVRGETSHDAWENRLRAQGLATVGPEGAYSTADVQKTAVDERARLAYVQAAFSDAIAIYTLSLALDFDYADLREREYPLLLAPALAERLRMIARLFPPNAGYEFAIRYRRRGLN